MGGAAGAGGIPAGVVRALAAGADLCCLGSGATDELVGACVDAVVAAVAAGDLDEARVHDAAERAAGLAGEPPAGTAPGWRRAAVRSAGRPPRGCCRSTAPALPLRRSNPRGRARRLGRPCGRRGACRVDGRCPAPDRRPRRRARRPADIAAGAVPGASPPRSAGRDPTVIVDPGRPGRRPGRRRRRRRRAGGRPLVVAARDRRTAAPPGRRRSRPCSPPGPTPSSSTSAGPPRDRAPAGRGPRSRTLRRRPPPAARHVAALLLDPLDGDPRG